MKRKIFNIILLGFVSLIAFNLSACNKDSKADYTVGICQLVQHAALDEATQGFKDALNEKMNEAGKTVKIDYQNAQNDTALCPTIVSSFVSNKYDLIMANATPALQAAFNATDSIPILGTSITTYGEALEITLNSDGSTGKNVSGTSDLASLSQQADMITEWVSDCESVAIIYCSSEANSVYQVQEMERYLTAKSIEVIKKPFADSTDISSVCSSCVGHCDAVYVPTDNTAASNTSIIDSVFRPENIPVFTGEANLCKSSEGKNACGVATFSISYYEIGKECGYMAAEILLENKDISTMPIRYDSNPQKLYNEEIATALGLTVPAGYTKIED